MRIERLRLEGYKRLLLRNIKTFEITPTTVHQVIIGTNGSGKSSVLRELTPLPPNQRDFIKGGSKTIELTHRGQRFLLRSEYSVGSGKHEFYINDGENLNPGGTATVQKELVANHLGYDEQLHRILLGIHKFSTIPALQRREILLKLSGTDLSFAMGLWNQLKASMRDQQGVVKHLNSRLAQEMDKVISQSQYDALHSEATLLTDELTILMSEREPGLEPLNVAKRALAEAIQEVDRIAANIMGASIVMPDWVAAYAPSGREDLETIDTEHQIALYKTESALEKYHEEHEEIRGIIEALSATNEEGIEGLKGTIQELRKYRDSLEQQLKFFLDVDRPNVREAYNKSMAVHPEVVDVLSRLPTNVDRRFSRHERDKRRELLKKTTTDLNDVRNQLAKIEHQLEHFSEIKAENCPKCGHSWTPGFDQGQLITLEKTRDALQVKVAELEHVQQDVTQYLEDFGFYAEMYRRFQQLVETATFMNPFWEYVLEDERQFNSPSSLLPMVESWIHDIRLHADIAETDAKLALYQQALEKAESTTGGEAYDQRITRVLTNIEDLTETSINQKRNQKLLYDFFREVDGIENEYRAFKRALQNVQHKVDELVRVIRRETIEKTISDNQTELAFVRRQLNTADAIQNIVIDIEKSLDNVKADFAAYKILVDELSPEDGLIADQLKGFIGVFVEQMNAIIEQIWTYELRILPCGVESGELDYKFGLVVNGEEAGKDVRDSDASTGQLEVIDFAFKLVVMLYLGMEDYPLYLDELGPHMDEEHRNNIMRFVHTLVETKKCSQLWLVSHFAAMHEIFNNVEYCVMDDRNIAVPQKNNTHVYFG